VCIVVRKLDSLVKHADDHTYNKFKKFKAATLFLINICKTIVNEFIIKAIDARNKNTLLVTSKLTVNEFMSKLDNLNTSLVISELHDHHK
jgi:hypothetical protein